MLNGSFPFVAVMSMKMKADIVPYQTYELLKKGEDKGFSIWETSKRIVYLCEHKGHLKRERKKSKSLRKKIVGFGNTESSKEKKYKEERK